MAETIQHYPLRPHVERWKGVLSIARRRKGEFNKQAQTAMGFYSGGHDWAWSKGAMAGFVNEEVIQKPTFQVQVNKAYEAVSIFGPKVYYQNPHRQVNPRRNVELPPEIFGNVMQDPMAFAQFQQFQMAAAMQKGRDDTRAALLEGYLNYTPNELGLLKEIRLWVDEAVIKGMSTMWTETYRRPGSNVWMVGSFWDSIDHLLLDPDATREHDCKWCSRTCIKPVWEVEDEFGLRRGTLEANYESFVKQGENHNEPLATHKRESGQTNDLYVYQKIYSRMGMGGLLKADKETGRIGSAAERVLEELGPNVYLVVGENTPFFLNLPPSLLEYDGPDAMEVIFDAVQWPTPFWADDAWPFRSLKWREIPGQLWPVGQLEPAMGELKAMNWIASMLLDKLSSSSRDFIATLKSVAKDVKQQIANGKGPFQFIELESASGSNLNEILQFAQHPPMNPDIWQVLGLFGQMFDMRTGLMPQLYGAPGASQSRSATDANIRSAGVDLRPDDMANIVEQACTMLARSEGIACRWHLTGQDVAPVFGQQVAPLWDQFVAGASLDEIVHETEYRIEAGSAKRPNKQQHQDAISQFMQGVSGIVGGWAQATGDPTPINALIKSFGESIDLQNVNDVLLPPIPPPAPPQGAAGPAAAQGEGR